MDVLTNLRTFLAVARTGGFSEAARQLHVVPSVVAKRIAQLEQTMQARLFERTTRHVALTEAGQRLKTRAASIVSDLDDVVNDVKRDESKLEGHIRVMAPTTITVMHLGPVFDSFMARHDRISLELALADRSINPVEEEVDMAISGRSASYDGVIDVPLSPVQPRLCASPDYVARRGMPAHPRDLVDHDCLVFRPNGNNWAFHSNRGIVRVDVSPRLLADDNWTLTQSCMNGRGIALLPEYVCGDAIASGKLLTLMPSFPLHDAWFKAFVPRRRHSLARVQALLQWLALHWPIPVSGTPPRHLEPHDRTETRHEDAIAQRAEPEPAGHA